MARVAGTKQATNELEMVYNAIEDYVFENHKFCSIDEVVQATSIRKRRCRRILDELTKNQNVSVVFAGKGKPTIYIPTYMLQDILRTQPKPKWIDNYAFHEKKGSLKQLEGARKELEQYETFERLLYGTSTPLEEAVAYALQYIEFPNVKHHKEEDLQDVSLTHNIKKYLLEIEGTTKQGDVRKVEQLHRWVRTEVDKGTSPDDVMGIFVVNHFRNRDPAERDKPLTPHAQRYLKMYRFKFFTTSYLFGIIKKVRDGSLAKEEARRLVVDGEIIS